MRHASWKLAVFCAALCNCLFAGRLDAATATLSGQVNTDANNKPFFNSSVSANPGGYSGTVASNANTISTVSGTGFQRAGTSILADLSDGNHIPLGVTIVHDVTFRVTGSANLVNGGNGGLGIQGATNNNLDTNETLFFDNLSVTTSYIDPLGLVQPVVAATNPAFRTLRSGDFDGTDSATVSTDNTQSDPQAFVSPTNPIADNFTTAITPRSTAFIKTNAGSWRLKGIEYQGTATFNLAPAPTSRRTFKFGEITPVYDGAASQGFTDTDTTVTLTAVGSGTHPALGLDSNEIGVGVNSAGDDAAAEAAQRRLDGTVGESINISFDKKVSLESLTIHNFEQTGIETAKLSFVSGTNPFTPLKTGYSSDYTFDTSSVSFKKTDTKGDTPSVITFGMGAQDDLIIEAGTILSLTSGPVVSNGFILAMLTANVIPTGVEGDYNDNGVVDAADYVLWRKDVTPLQHEVTGVTTGDTTNEDYTAWRERFGNPNPGAGGDDLSQQGVPEPASVVLMGLAALIFAVTAQRSHR